MGESDSPESVADVGARVVRALAVLHDAQGLDRQGDVGGAYSRYVEAASAFEQILLEFDIGPTRRFLAQAYAGACRLQDALEVLRLYCRLVPDDDLAASERDRIETEARTTIVRRSLQFFLRGTPPSATTIMAANRDLLDDSLEGSVHVTALHYADQVDASVFSAVRALLGTLAEVTGNAMWKAIDLEALGVMYLARREPVAALPLLTDARDIYDALDAIDFAASASSHLGVAGSYLGAFWQAEQDFARAIDSFTAKGDGVALARVLENLAGLLVRRSDFSRAVEVAQRAVSLFEEKGHLDLALKAKIVLALAMTRHGQRADALRVISEVTLLGGQIWADHPELLASAMGVRGEVLEHLGRLADAHRCLIEAGKLPLATTTASAASMIHDIGSLRADLNEYDEAIRHELRLLASHQDAGREFDVARDKVNLAKLLKGRFMAIPFSSTSPADVGDMVDDLANTVGLLDEAIGTFRRLDQPGLAIDARRERAWLLRWFGQAEDAVEELDACVKEALHVGDLSLAASILQNIASLKLDLGSLDEARTALLNATHYATVSGDESLRTYLDRVRVQIERLDGDIGAASETYRRLIRRYEDAETAVGDPEVVVEWSQTRGGVFDDALRFFLDIGDNTSAYEVVVRSKARTFQRALSKGRGPTAALSARDVAIHLREN